VHPPSNFENFTSPWPEAWKSSSEEWKWWLQYDPSQAIITVLQARRIAVEEVILSAKRKAPVGTRSPKSSLVQATKISTCRSRQLHQERLLGHPWEDPFLGLIEDLWPTYLVQNSKPCSDSPAQGSNPMMTITTSLLAQWCWIYKHNNQPKMTDKFDIKYEKSSIAKKAHWNATRCENMDESVVSSDETALITTTKTPIMTLHITELIRIF
jgi:hypothetical protein